MFNILYFKKVTSTMDVLNDYPANTLIVADEQTKGRGKADRTWVSQDKKNLYFSFKIEVEGNYVFNYVFIVGIVILETLEYFFKDIKLKLKWPNDLLLNEKKVAGILLERDLTKNLLVIGIGLNINSYPVNTLFKATSLKDEGYIIDKKIFVNKFIDVFGKYNLNNFKIVREKWLSYAYNFKKEIEVKTNNLSIKGIFEDLDNDGSLILKKDDNECIKIFSGDIF
ncbi:MAG: biotin--[acetyl-CoA-carboxylase] ligase [Rickettsiales bacterium]|jgi:BirA family biotin operon repressor/biotin-[acetyl-CoA-carboxylase] ligase|nr:biotin--[acetyl-CoA-carboxylase] ligase [Rickettsiales bacterium]